VSLTQVLKKRLSIILGDPNRNRVSVSSNLEFRNILCASKYGKSG